MFALQEDVRVKLGSGRQVGGALRVGASEGFLGGWLGELLRSFKFDNPAVEVTLHIDITGPLLDSLASGHLDIVFGITCGSVNADEILWKDQLVWAFSESATVDRAQPLPVAFFPEPCPLRAAAVAALSGSGARWRLACVSPSAAGIRAAASFGLGVTPTLRSQLAPGLVEVGSELELPALPVVEFAVWTTGQTRSAAVQQLLAAVRSDIHRGRPMRMSS
jgi:DNA-binding transcriptional LysR family regulator